MRGSGSHNIACLYGRMGREEEETIEVEWQKWDGRRKKQLRWSGKNEWWKSLFTGFSSSITFNRKVLPDLNSPTP